MKVKVKKSISVEEFVYNLLKENGCEHIKVYKDSITCRCPFHLPKKNYKCFRISTIEVYNKKTGIKGYYYHCFSCGAKGSIPKLIKFLTGCSKKKALKIFNKKTGINFISIDSLKKRLYDNYNNIKKNITVKLPPIAENQQPMYNYLEKRKKMYHNILNIDYIVDKYRLYYCDSGYYMGRIIMPLYDDRGKLVAFNDRIINDNAKLKSLHAKDFPYGDYFHGLYENKNNPYAIIVEGAFDMFQIDSVLYQLKDNKFAVINIMGTNISDTRIALLYKYFSKIYLMFDYDKAGLKALYQWYGTLMKDIEVYDCVTTYPASKDPGKCTKLEIIRAIKYAKKIKFKQTLLEEIKNVI